MRNIYKKIRKDLKNIYGRKLSTSELLLITLVLFLFNYIIEIPLIVRVLIFALLIFLVVLILYVLSAKSRNLPRCCKYNIFGHLEIHIDNKCKHNQFIFIERCFDVIAYAAARKMKIMFDTNLIKKENLLKLFDESIEIYNPSLVQSLINFILKNIYRGNLKRKYFRAIINTEKITEGQLEKIKLYKEREKVLKI